MGTNSIVVESKFSSSNISSLNSYDVTSTFSTSHLIKSLNRNKKSFSVFECALYCSNNFDCYSFTYTYLNSDTASCKLLNDKPKLSSDIVFSRNASIFVLNSPRRGHYSCLYEDCDQTKGLTCLNKRCTCALSDR